ncbi:MAG TPA: ribonuclease J [Dehalococcoidia bacterium]|nr:ribonuclease J [Dehalococcoidia bacterium]
MTALRVIPLGGLGEIGRNMMLYEYGEDMIAVDVGLMFPEEEMLGVDLVIPEITYVMDDPSKLKAVFLTHGHEDHIGALPFLLKEVNVPVFCTRLTRGLVEVKLREHKLHQTAQVNVVEVGQTVNVGAFGVEFFSVSHSIPDAAGLIVHTPLGPVVHTGDFKIDHTPVMDQHTDLQRLAEIGREGALLLAMDSTYVEIEGYTPSEQTVAESLDRAIADAPDRVIVTTFASLISRIQMVIDAAEKHGRRVFVTGRSMVNNVQMARDLGYLRVPAGIMMNAREMTEHPTAKTVIICTGSQGEPTSALTRMANGTHQNVTIQRDDTVILSSNPVPGNEMLVYRNIDNLYRAGAHVIYNRLAPVHVRGHASQEELKIIHRIVRPRHFIGIHGEYRHLVLHRQLAISLGMSEEDAITMTNGDVLEIDEDGARIVDQVSAEYVYVDGLGVGDVDHIVLRDRQHLASDGMVVVVVALNRQLGELLRPPEVMSHGFVGPEEEPEIIEGVQSVVMNVLGGERQHVDWTGIRETLKDDVATYLHQQTHRRPLVLPITVEV